MACYCQAASTYLNQCWTRSMLPCGVTKPQWVNGVISLLHLPIHVFIDWSTWLCLLIYLSYTWLSQIMLCIVTLRWVGGGGFSKVVATFNHVGGAFNLFMATTGDVRIIPSFSNFRLCAAYWAHFMCHHELWLTSVSHLFSSLNSSSDSAGGKDYQKTTIPIFRLILQNFAIPGYFPYIIFYSCLFSLLSSAWFVIAVCGFISVQGTS